MRTTGLCTLVLVSLALIAASAVGTTAQSPGPGTPSAASPDPAASPMPLRQGSLAAGTYVVTPYVPPGRVGLCFVPPQPGCTESTDDDAIRFTFTVPDGWQGGATGFWSVWSVDRGGAPGEAAIVFLRGSDLYRDPCATDGVSNPDMAIGPTVDDFAGALAGHPLLDTSLPVDVTLAGYPGKSMVLQVPLDISACYAYFPWGPGLEARGHEADGPAQRWHLWILDVDGVRVVIQVKDYAETSPQVRAELQGILESMQIEP